MCKIHLLKLHKLASNIQHASQTKYGHAQDENDSKTGVGKKGISSYLFKLKM